MPNRVKETVKATNAEQIQEKAKLIHGAAKALPEIYNKLAGQHKTGTIDFFDDYTAEEYIQFKSDLRCLFNISDSILEFLEEYEETYF